MIEGEMSEESARRMSILDLFRDFLPLVALAERAGADLFTVGRVLWEIRKLLNLDSIRKMAALIPIRDRWDRQAQEDLLEALGTVEAEISRGVLESAKGNPDAFLARHRSKIRIYRGQMESLKGTSPPNLHPLEVLVRELEGLVS